MNRSEPAARVYADALLQIGKEKGRLEAVLDDLRGVKSVLHGDPEIWALFTSPRIDRGVKERLLREALHGQVGEEVVGLIVVLIRKGREPLFDNVVDYFHRLKDLEQKRIHIHVRSARGVDGETRKALEAIVQEASGKNPVFHETTDPSLVGGMVVRVNDIVVDGSLRTRLRALRDRLLGSRG